MIEAKVICDSIGEHSSRLTTFQLRYPKFIHGEFLTHRAFGRNASSSRAIPVSKNLEEARSDVLRAAPVWWGREQKGMQSGEGLETDTDPNYHYLSPLGRAQEAWEMAAHAVVEYAIRMQQSGAHKSIVNRILEPFLHINVVVTSCEPGLLNFFGLRLDRAAQPEMRVLAEAMWKVWNESTPTKLEPGQWHLPFVDEQAVRDSCQSLTESEKNFLIKNKHPSEFSSMNRDGPGKPGWLVKVSVARCARVSYLSHETGKRSTIEEDLGLYDRLLGSQPLHASPAEHQATPDEWYESISPLIRICWKNPTLHGNLPGWRQFRKTLPGEAVAPLPEGYSYQQRTPSR